MLILYVPVYYQDQVGRRVRESVMRLGDEHGHLLSRRPFQVTWFSSQVAICLALYNYDRSLITALDLAKSFLIPLDALNALWPCEGEHSRSWDVLSLMDTDFSNESHGSQSSAFVEMNSANVSRMRAIKQASTLLYPLN